MPRKCNTEKCCKRRIVCSYRKPIIRENACVPNKKGRGVLRKLTSGCYEQSKCFGNSQYEIETTLGKKLIPINLNDFCYSTGARDGDVVGFTYEEIDSCKNYCSGKPIRLMWIAKVWNRLILEAVGVIRRVPTKIPHYVLIDTRNNIEVTYVIVNIVNEQNVQEKLNRLVGKEVTVTYMDEGEEDDENLEDVRCGIPIIILTLKRI